MVIGVIRSSNRAKSPKMSPQQETVWRHIQTPKQRENMDVDQLSHVDHVITNAHCSRGESQLYISEDNEAVMFIKGRSPTMRHVSRTHKVAHD